MGLLALAVAPGIAICIFIYLKDKYNREPLGLLLFSFVLGMCSIIPALMLEKAFGLSQNEMTTASAVSLAVFAYAVVAVSEEGSKFLMVRLFCYPRKAFDDPFDGIVYSVMVSMGFATLENIGYVMEHGVATGIVRMFLSVPAHATFAILMGYHIGLAKFDPARRGMHFFLAIFWPVVFHGTFDFFLFKADTLLHIAGALVSFIIAIRLSKKAIRKKQAISKAFMSGVDSITQQDNSLF
ncbi:MAG: PrsW family intramembrane metalloprotease [Bacteroidetes bacterium]|nr:PrsW family intramembrane metalloprotease [Bacteroidota bacterium]